MFRFDGGIFFGREPKYGISASPEEVLLRMNQSHTTYALATDLEAIFFDMYSGNEKTLAVCRTHPTLLPLAVLNPMHYDYTSTYLDKIVEQSFRGVSFFPHYQYWNVRNYTFRTLVRDCSDRYIPIQIALASLDDLSSVVDVIADLSTPVLLRCIRGGGYLNIADMISIGKDFPHIVFDVGNVVTLGGIAHLVKTLGAHRLYLATNMPLVYEASGQLLVDTADISEEDKRQISYKTLSNIFNVAIHDESMEGVPAYLLEIQRPKIDIHWHGEGWDIIEPRKGAEGLLQVIEDFHYEAVITSSILALNYNLQRGNRATKEIAERDPRIFGYVVYDPTRIEESVEELERYKIHPKFVGIKTIQDYYGIGLDDSRYEPMLRWAEKEKWPILCHRQGAGEAARAFPNVQFVVAHGTSDRMKEFIGAPNIVVDISASYAHRGETNVPAMIDRLGEDRILFAADGPLMTPVWSIGKIISTDMLESVKEKIYRGNALRVFQRLTI